MCSALCGILVLCIVSTLPVQRPAPGEIPRLVMVDGSPSIEMKDIAASRRSRTGFYSSSKQYFYFARPKAVLRTRTTQPVFEFEAESTDDDPVYLFRFDRKSDRREITVSTGFGGLSEFAVPKDHLVATTVEEVSRGAGSTRRYRLKLLAPLRPGEYCVTRNISVCFDFGVD